MKILSISATLVFLFAQNSFALSVSDASEAAEKCAGIYSCDSETIAGDNRNPLHIEQPANPTPVKGLCGVIPSGLDYQARPTGLSCSGGTDTHVREPIKHSDDEIDKNFSLLSIGNRNGAQKALQKNFGWENKIKTDVLQTWTYMRKVGAYTNCSGRPGAQGGEVESYQTTCFRNGRKEKVQQRVIVYEKYCAVATPKPPEPEPETHSSSPIVVPSPSSGGGSYGSNRSNSSSRPYTAPSSGGSSSSRSSGSSYGSSRSGGGSSGSSRRQADKPIGQSKGEIRERARRGRSTSSDFKLEQMKLRAPALSLRQINDDVSTVQGSTPTYGCDRWDTREIKNTVVETYVDAEDIMYQCTKTRNRWCTWYEPEQTSQMCPESKTTTINVKYVTSADWNPGNSKYDDQMPNKFDLLLGEAERIDVAINNKLSRPTMTPSVEIANAMATRKQAWNKYSTRFVPATLDCKYEDQKIDLEIEAEERIVQNAPNPLEIPRDESNKDIALTGELDSKGRPKNLNLKNKARGQVLDRSNLSRIYGTDQDKTPAQKRAGIARKAWENTRFWMRLWWLDGETKVKVTLGRHFNINQASPEGDQLSISLAGENGMDRFYKMAVPFEKLFGFLGGDIALDPNRKYEIEIKTAQPGFDGIYISGLDDDSSLSDEEKKLVNKDAYSESLWIPFDASQSKRSLMDIFWDWRAKRMWRP